MGSLVKLVELASRGDSRGGLVVAECGRELPFPVRRAYILHSTLAGAERGFHAHIALNQLAVALAGKVRMTLDDGHSREDVWLDSPSKGLLIGPGLWREMRDFSPDCVLLVLADREYDEADYIRDYNLFLKAWHF